MSILVDSSVWIDYFRGDAACGELGFLIEEDLIVTNDLILAELIPPLRVRRENELVGLLKEIKRAPIELDWDELVDMQVACLKNGINAVGIPDLMIAQNVMQNDLQLLTHDKHFELISRHLPLMMFEEE